MMWCSVFLRLFCAQVALVRMRGVNEGLPKGQGGPAGGGYAGWAGPYVFMTLLCGGVVGVTDVWCPWQGFFQLRIRFYFCPYGGVPLTFVGLAQVDLVNMDLKSGGYERGHEEWTWV